MKLLKTMRFTAVLISASLSVTFFLSSCSAPKETVRPEGPASPPVVAAEPKVKITPPPPKSVPSEPVRPVPQPRYKTSYKCGDDTNIVFNSCGIEVLPFVRTCFFDIDGDGSQEMIAGSKDGRLRLYRNNGTPDRPSWSPTYGLLDDISANAFSAPAAGDIDGDGLPEVVIGTGGFSSDSGKVLIFKNYGTRGHPVWRAVDVSGLSVGNDAAPTLADLDGDGKPDLIVGNSTGNFVLFRNRSSRDRIQFRRDDDYFKGIRLGMYVVPAAAADGGRVVVIAGNDMGRLYLLERKNGKKTSWSKSTLKISTPNFAAPSFLVSEGGRRRDLIISDGNGQFTYYINRKNDLREWEKISGVFEGRILAGPASAPSVTSLNGRPYMVVGNINGEIRLFEYSSSAKPIPWTERQGFFRNIKLSGFSRGMLTEWQGRQLLITGQQDGLLRAFLNTGSLDLPAWTEQKRFFASIPRIMHATPAIFDIDGDGKWDLIVGDADGRVSGFRYKTGSDGAPLWEAIKEGFEHVRVDRFAAPAMFEDSGTLYLLVGQQDGRVFLYSAAQGRGRFPVFREDDYLDGIKVHNHSSPTAVAGNGMIEISIGDYNGNLKHFACEKTLTEIKDN